LGAVGSVWVPAPLEEHALDPQQERTSPSPATNRCRARPEPAEPRVHVFMTPMNALKPWRMPAVRADAHSVSSRCSSMSPSRPPARNIKLPSKLCGSDCWYRSRLWYRCCATESVVSTSCSNAPRCPIVDRGIDEREAGAGTLNGSDATRRRCTIYRKATGVSGRPSASMSPHVRSTVRELIEPAVLASGSFPTKWLASTTNAPVVRTSPRAGDARFRTRACAQVDATLTADRLRGAVDT
jgi:hypothetical protein